MEFIVMDIESTGLNRNVDIPLEVAFLKFNSDCSAVKESGVMYFYKTGIRWSDEAEAIHGLSREFLTPYEKDYYINLRKLYRLVSRSNLVGHNVKSFDFPFLTHFLAREMYGQVAYNNIYDTMRIFQPVFHKPMKLRDLTEALGAPEEILNSLHKKWFGTAPRQSWHGASYDVVATSFCLLEAKRRNLLG